MFTKLRLILLGIVGVLAIALFYVLVILPPKVDAATNPVAPRETYAASAAALTLHEGLRVGDLHADTLLWKRDPQKSHDYGQSDMPRYRSGGVALQVFAAVTYVPAKMNESENARGRDSMIPLTMAQLWPASTWFSPYGRARYQAKRLRTIEREDEDFFIIRSKEDLAALLAGRATNKNIMGGILALEGAHPFEGELANIETLYDDGYRLVGLQHFFDNELGASLHGVSKGGLSDFGRAAIADMLERGLIIDVAHSSVKVVEEVLALTDAPILISHTGILSKCDHPTRNIPDRLLQKIADRGGLIGIGYWEMAVCDTSPAGIAETLAYGARVFGVDAIALGSDFDGGVKTQFDTSELALITDGLLSAGLSQDDIAKIMGENMIRFFGQNLP